MYRPCKFTCVHLFYKHFEHCHCPESRHTDRKPALKGFLLQQTVDTKQFKLSKVQQQHNLLPATVLDLHVILLLPRLTTLQQQAELQ